MEERKQKLWVFFWFVCLFFYIEFEYFLCCKAISLLFCVAALHDTSFEPERFEGSKIFHALCNKMPH